jgi:hypothetical protein
MKNTIDSFHVSIEYKHLKLNTGRHSVKTSSYILPGIL